MGFRITERSLPLLLAALVALPVRAGADYLYSVFREGCTTDTVTRYSGADPIIATVHLEGTEIDRIASNYMTWGGFQLVSDSFVETTLPNNDKVKHLSKTKGRLYALRLFKEKTPNSNQWEFLTYNNDTVLDSCDITSTDRTFSGSKNQVCIFEAGEILTQRPKRNTYGMASRHIYTGVMGTKRTPTTGNEGAVTIPITSTQRLNLDSYVPTSDHTNWGSLNLLGLSTLEAYLGSSSSVQALRTAWEAYVPRVSDAMDSSELPTGLPESVTSSTLQSPTNLQLAKILKWLHGEGAIRDWDLGDIYHSSTAVVEAPERYYRDRAYPYFKQMFKKRPEMIYVGANDGMIHAFHAGNDVYAGDPPLGDNCGGTPRYRPGDEAWAYLPANMLAKTLVAVEGGRQRFYSQDLSCRFTDVQIDTSFTTCDETNWKWPWQLSASEQHKAYCGWRTLLHCGQGWGGSWYVTLDVTDPMAPFRNSDGTMACSRTDQGKPMQALWEFTYQPTSTSSVAMGKSWSLPFIGLVNFDGVPKWLTMMGSGYNTDHHNCPKYSTGGGGTCSSITTSNKGSVLHGTKKSFGWLNLNYDGAYPDHGDGIGQGAEGAYSWVLDVANGEVLKSFTFDNQKAAVADIPAVDSDMNGLIDAAYVAGWDGGLARIYFGDTSTTLASIGHRNGTDLCLVSSMAGQRILATHPTAFGVPPRSTDTFRDRVMTVLGSGVNSGDDPDQQRNNGNYWDIDARIFTDTGSSTCPSGSAIVCGANSWWTVNDNDQGQKPRLLGAPIFSRQSNGDDWIIYTTWSPPGDQCSKEGVARLWCLDVTNDTACSECDGFEANGNRYSITLYAGEQPPSAPVAADGNIYVAGEDGPMQQGITNSDGQGPNANSFAPTTAVLPRVVSWRETF